MIARLAPGARRAVPLLRGRAPRCSSPRTRPTRERLFGRPRTARPYVKDGINDYVVHGRRERGESRSRRARRWRRTIALTVAPGESRDAFGCGSVTWRRRARPDGDGARAVRPRLRRRASNARRRRRTSSTPPSSRRRSNADAANVMRQALAGMLWSKQFYYYDVDRWLEEHGADPLQAGAQRRAAQRRWHHMYNDDVISMPDKWEYPWYAAWDLAFHVLALTLVDEDFGKQQLDLMLRGSLPAPERADARLRVELRRRQPAGARLGHDLHVPAGEGAAGPGRRRLARAHASRSCC